MMQRLVRWATRRQVRWAVELRAEWRTHRSPGRVMTLSLFALVDLLVEVAGVVVGVALLWVWLGMGWLELRSWLG